MKIDWTKYFDHIFCIHYISKDRIERHHQLINELTRVGIYDSGIFSFIYDEDSLFTNKLYNDISIDTGYGVVDYSKRVTLNHYKALNISKLLGYKNVLIIEDDIVFLKDLQVIKNALEESQNKDFEVCQYDYINYSDIWYAFATCYHIRSKGIDKLLENIETSPTYVIDQYFTSTNEYYYTFGGDRHLISFPNLLNCIQNPTRIAIQRNNDAYKTANIEIDYNSYEN